MLDRDAAPASPRLTGRTREPAPSSLVSGGRVRFGVFDGAIAHVNPLEAEGTFDAPMPRAFLRFRLKEWEAFQIWNERFFIVLALFDAKTLALAQAKIYDRETRTKHVFERKLPSWKLRVASGLGRSCTDYQARDCRVRFDNRLDEGRIEIDLDLPPQAAFGGLSGHLVARVAGWDPLVVSIPFADNRGMYSHKGLASVEGELVLGRGERIVLEPESTQLVVDDHKGFYPFEMKWDWATAMGKSAAGRHLAFNLTRNQSTDQERYNENCLWVDGRAHLLPPVRFERSGCSVGDRWAIRDTEGRVDLEFEIEVEGRVDIRALVLRSDYHGPFGTFRGKILDDTGHAHRVDGLFGMGEQFYLRC